MKYVIFFKYKAGDNMELEYDKSKLQKEIVWPYLVLYPTIAGLILAATTFIQ